MLFLFNEVVFDLGDARETVLRANVPLGAAELQRLSVARTVKLVRETVFDDPNLAHSNPQKAIFLAALLAWKTAEANALLAVRPAGITHPRDVRIRLASVTLVTLQQLRDLQDAGTLSSHVANLSVWAVAPQRMQA